MMLEGIYYVEPNIMNVINSFHDTAMVHIGDQQRIHTVGQSNKGKHVSFEDVVVVTEPEAQNMFPLVRRRLELLLKRRKK